LSFQWVSVPPAEGSSHCCSHIQRRGGRPSRRKPGRKSPRRLGNWSDPCRGASKLAGRSKCANRGSPVMVPPHETDLRDRWECRAADILAKAKSTWLLWNLSMFELPGVVGDGMPGRNEQRKLGTTRGWPRRSRTAEAAHISRRAAKLRCAREWGGWGRLSDDGSGQHNPNRSEDPWGRWRIPPHGGAVYRVDRSDFERINVEARRAKTNRTSVSVCREQA